MSKPSHEPITLYTSSWCSHAISVERYLERNQVAYRKVDIDDEPEARQALVRLNGGYASVPTLLFPDGSKLTEPTLAEIRKKLALDQSPGLATRIRGILAGKDRDAD
jgi:mycoredoxin